MSGGELTQEYLKSVLRYDAETGHFWWIERKKGRRQGRPAGLWRKMGHLSICIDYRHYYAQRLAFLYMTGRWPIEEINHIDYNKCNNTWANLREATRSQNEGNKQRLRRNNSSGLHGVSWHKRARKWVGQIMHGSEYRYLGLFDTAEAAHAAYERAAKESRGEFYTPVVGATS